MDCLEKTGFNSSEHPQIQSLYLSTCGRLTLAEFQAPTQAALSLSPSAGQGRSNTTKGSWVKVRSGMSRHITYQLPSSWAKPTWLAQFSLVYYKLNPSRMMRDRIKCYNTFPHPALLNWLNFQFSLIPTPQCTGGQGMGAVVTSPHLVSAAPSSSGGGLLTFFPCSSVGSLPQETLLHQLLRCESFLQAVVLHKLPQHGSLSQGAALQEQTPSE